MNKYSKRALKTTATVGMSLAMVLSGVAAPVKAAITATVCQTSEKSQAEELLAAMKYDLSLYTDLNYALGKKTLSNLQLADSITWTKTAALLKAGELTAPATISTLLAKKVLVLPFGGVSGTDEEEFTLENFLIRMADCFGLDDAKFLVGHEDDVNRQSIDDAIALVNTAITAVDNYAGTDLTGAAGATAYTNYKNLNDFYAKYKDNLPASSKTIYDDKFPAYSAAVLEYRNADISTMTRNYVTALEGLSVVTNGSSVRDLVKYNDTNFAYTDLAKLEEFIKDVKGDKKTALTAVASYKEVENEDVVSDIIGRLEEMVEEIKEVKALISTSNTLTKEFKKLDSKIGALASAASAVKTAGSSVTDALTLAYERALTAFRSDEIETVVEYVESNIFPIYTVKVRNFSSGNVGLETEKAEYGRYVSASVAIPTNLSTILTTNLVKTTEESVYDVLTSNFTDVDKLIKACTTDIEGLTIGTVVTDANAVKIIAAKKAFDSLTDPLTEYTLTTKEKRAVKSNEALIDALYTKLILSGIVKQTGWVDKGNGNWDFLNPDGSAPTKWVAAGTDWYYVKGGAMLRNSWIANDATGSKWYYVDDAGKMVSNTTVNGYAFDANGVWVK